METNLLEPILARFGVGDPEWLDPATSGAIVLIAVVVAFVVHKLVFPIIIRFTNWTPTDLDSRLVKSARWPITLGILVLGIYLALSVPLDLSSSQQGTADAVGRALGVVLAIMMVPAADVARAVASSPTGCASVWKAVGAMRTGKEIRCPSTWVDVSTVDTSMRTRGYNVSRSKAARFFARVISSSVPPAT